MKVTLIARTKFNDELAEGLTGWEPDGAATDAASLSEFAGRACYGSWNKPNPATRANDGYLAHIFEVSHLSVVEHGSATFYVEDVSRSLTHELVRHRHHSYSQLSQRFVVMDGATSPVIPPLFAGDQEAGAILASAWEGASVAYDLLVSMATDKLKAQGVIGTALKKEAREAARCVLPNMTPTAIVITGNHRSWREFLIKRGSLAADAEIRMLAVEIYRWLDHVEENLYQDFMRQVDSRGREYLEYRG